MRVASRWRSGLAAAAVLGVVALGVATWTSAEVVKVDIATRADVGNGAAFGNAGAIAQVSPEAIVRADPDVLLFAGADRDLKELVAQAQEAARQKAERRRLRARMSVRLPEGMADFMGNRQALTARRSTSRVRLYPVDVIPSILRGCEPNDIAIFTRN